MKKYIFLLLSFLVLPLSTHAYTDLVGTQNKTLTSTQANFQSGTLWNWTQLDNEFLTVAFGSYCSGNTVNQYYVDGVLTVRYNDVETAISQVESGVAGGFFENSNFSASANNYKWSTYTLNTTNGAAFTTNLYEGAKNYTFFRVNKLVTNNNPSGSTWCTQNTNSEIQKFYVQEWTYFGTTWTATTIDDVVIPENESFIALTQPEQNDVLKSGTNTVKGLLKHDGTYNSVHYDLCHFIDFDNPDPEIADDLECESSYILIDENITTIQYFNFDIQVENHKTYFLNVSLFSETSPLISIDEDISFIVNDFGYTYGDIDVAPELLTPQLFNFPTCSFTDILSSLQCIGDYIIWIFNPVDAINDFSDYFGQFWASLMDMSALNIFTTLKDSFLITLSNVNSYNEVSIQDIDISISQGKSVKIFSQDWMTNNNLSIDTSYIRDIITLFFYFLFFVYLYKRMQSLFASPNPNN